MICLKNYAKINNYLVYIFKIFNHNSLLRIHSDFDQNHNY